MPIYGRKLTMALVEFSPGGSTFLVLVCRDLEAILAFRSPTAKSALRAQWSSFLRFLGIWLPAGDSPGRPDYHLTNGQSTRYNLYGAGYV